MHLFFRTILMFLRRRSPLDFTDVSRLEMRVLPTDIDLAGHMNNGFYLSVMDLGRFDLLIRSGVWPKLRRAGFAPVMANAVRVLCTLPGIGPWTAAEAVQRAMSGADAVSVGDYHLPNVVGWALVGRKLDDAGMLEVLAPYAPHRARAIRLTEVGPAPRPPKRGPRFSPRDYRAF